MLLFVPERKKLIRHSRKIEIFSTLAFCIVAVCVYNIDKGYFYEANGNTLSLYLSLTNNIDIPHRFSGVLSIMIFSLLTLLYYVCLCVGVSDFISKQEKKYASVIRYNV